MTIAIPQSEVPAPAQAPNPREQDSVLPFAAWTLAAMIALLVLLPLVSHLWTPGSSGPSRRPGPVGEPLAAWRLSIRGIGPIRVGMTRGRAAHVLGRPLLASKRFPSSGSCTYVELQGGPDGIFFMVIADRIARVDILNPLVETRAGARIGLTESQILALFPGRIKLEPHPSAAHGHNLVYMPKTSADQDYSMVFETDGEIVTAIRAGRRREVGYVEHCL